MWVNLGNGLVTAHLHCNQQDTAAGFYLRSQQVSSPRPKSSHLQVPTGVICSSQNVCSPMPTPSCNSPPSLPTTPLPVALLQRCCCCSPPAAFGYSHSLAPTPRRISAHCPTGPQHSPLPCAPSQENLLACQSMSLPCCSRHQTSPLLLLRGRNLLGPHSSAVSGRRCTAVRLSFPLSSSLRLSFGWSLFSSSWSCPSTSIAAPLWCPRPPT